MVYSKDFLKYHEDGKEHPSNKPSRPIMNSGMPGSDYEMERIKQMVRGEISKHAQEQGQESFEEANDFDCEEPFDAFDTIETKYMTPEFPDVDRLPPPEEKPVAPETSPSPKNGEVGAAEPTSKPDLGSGEQKQ